MTRSFRWRAKHISTGTNDTHLRDTLGSLFRFALDVNVSEIEAWQGNRLLIDGHCLGVFYFAAILMNNYRHIERVSSQRG